jgi:carbonic anhydrase/acetyltransferase-like protein (isoleucine patch superfamily)
MQIDFLHYRPALAAPVTQAPDAVAIGRVTAGPGLDLRALVALRADGEAIHVGADVHFGARSTAHIADGTLPARIGDAVTVGRFALVHACTLEAGVVVADAATIMDGATVGAQALIAPDALVPPRKALPGGFVYSGNPAQAVRRVDADELAAAARALRRGAPVPGLPRAALPPLDLVSFDAPAGGPGALQVSAGAPTIGRAFVAPTAALVGDVTIGDDAGVYFGCVLAAGDARIVVGAGSNVQDNSLLVTDRARGDLVLGERVTIGHNVRMSSGEIGDGALVGMSSVVGERVVIERGGCIAAGAWVEAGSVVRAGWIWAGRPARPFRELKPAERTAFARGVDIYVRYGSEYRGAIRR